jgi:hypothetical protein
LHGEGGAPGDVFAWAVTVAYALTGRPPFGTGPTEAVLMRVLHAEPDLEGLPAPVLDVVRRATAKDPSWRPTAFELVQALTPAPEPVPGTLPYTAPLPSPAVPTSDRVAPDTSRRPRRWVVVMAGTAALAVGGALGSFVLHSPPHATGQAAAETVRPAGAATPTPSSPVADAQATPGNTGQDTPADTSQASPYDLPAPGQTATPVAGLPWVEPNTVSDLRSYGITWGRAPSATDCEATPITAATLRKAADESNAAFTAQVSPHANDPFGTLFAWMRKYVQELDKARYPNPEGAVARSVPWMCEILQGSDPGM